MKNGDIGITDEWFLKEKEAINAILSDDCSSSLSVEDFAVKAKAKIKTVLRNDTRSPIERARFRDALGNELLDLMREVRGLNNYGRSGIAAELKKRLGVSLPLQQIADIARMKFVNEYDLYLRRVYLSWFGDVIAWILFKYREHDSGEQFLRFLSENKTICLEIGVGISDFEFTINNKNYVTLAGATPKERSAELMRGVLI